MPERRKLTFATLNDAVVDAENLLAKGYDKAGNWDLAQVCGHLALWVKYSMDGVPKPPLLLRPLFWVFRNTLAARQLRKLTAPAAAMPAGMPTVPQSVPPAGGAAAEAVAALRAAVERFEAHTGPLAPSPLLGRMTKDQLTAVHRVHAAHHLSFLVPKA